LFLLNVAGAKDKKAGGGGKQQVAGKTPGPGAAGVNDADDDDRPRALQLELSVKLCVLAGCDTDAAQLTAAATDDVAN